MQLIEKNNSSDHVLAQGKLAVLVPFSKEHLDKALRWANSPDLSLLMGRSRPLSRSEHEEWFSNLHKRKDCLFFAVETKESRDYVGYVWLWNIDPLHRKSELRILLGESTGKGIGSEVINLAAAYGFDHLNLHKVYAYVLSINQRGKRAFEKVGFEQEGLLREDRFSNGAYIDVYLLGKLNPKESSSGRS